MLVTVVWATFTSNNTKEFTHPLAGKYITLCVCVCVQMYMYNTMTLQ